MKLLTIFLSSILFLNNIYAKETISKDITDNTIIKYKWYLENKIDGVYHKINESLSGYKEDINNISYGKYSDWNTKYCEYSPKEYMIEERPINWRYKKVKPIKYVIIENLQAKDDIKIFYKQKEIKYTEEEKTSNKIILNLNDKYEANNLVFYINTNQTYNIELFYTSTKQQPVLSKQIENSFIVIPDKTWIQETTTYLDTYLGAKEPENDFLELIEIYNECRVREIQTYRYKVTKQYFDDNYHKYIEGYLKDEQDFIVEYLEDFPTNIIEITKTEIKPVNKYIYLEKNQEIQVEQKDTSTKENITNIKPTKIIEKKEFITKEIPKIPIKIYIAIIILVFIVIIQTIKLLKKSNETYD